MPKVVDFKTDLPRPESYRPEAGKVLAGDPEQTVANAFSSADGRFNCGVWTGEPGTWAVTFTETEFCHLLEGRVVVTDTGGASQTFVAGDAFVMPAGFQGTWQVLERARKYYAVYE